MESTKPYPDNLTSLGELKKEVDAYEALCLPDITLNTHTETKIEFRPYEDQDIWEMMATLEVVRKGTPDTLRYYFTRWSRAQLLSRLGGSEKWFQTVSVNIECEELNTRVHALEGMVLRTKKVESGAGDPHNLVRGLVSSVYADIPDTYIVQSLADLIGTDAPVLRRLSVKTDRAFYAYILAPDTLTLPGMGSGVRPGIVIRNSEVGYSSLTASLCYYFPAWRAVSVIGKDKLLKQIHRGTNEDLPRRFSEALGEAKEVWGSVEGKLKKLRDVTYINEDAAIAAMSRLLLRSGASKGLLRLVVNAYERQSKTTPTHNALRFVDALGEVTGRASGDEAYNQGVIAGNVLFMLLNAA